MSTQLSLTEAGPGTVRGATKAQDGDVQPRMSTAVPGDGADVPRHIQQCIEASNRVFQQVAAAQEAALDHGQPKEVRAAERGEHRLPHRVFIAR